jgi:hypothetical protein
MFQSTNMNRRKAFRSPVLLALAAAAIFAPAALAQPQDTKEIPYLSAGVGITRPAPGQGAVTPTDLARAYQAPELGVSRPDGYQPQLQGDQPIVVRDTPDGYQPQTRTVEASSASGSGIDADDMFRGFLLGVLLASAAALALSVVRRGPRTAAQS